MAHRVKIDSAYVDDDTRRVQGSHDGSIHQIETGSEGLFGSFRGAFKRVPKAQEDALSQPFNSGRNANWSIGATPANHEPHPQYRQHVSEFWDSFVRLFSWGSGVSEKFKNLVTASTEILWDVLTTFVWFWSLAQDWIFSRTYSSSFWLANLFLETVWWPTFAATMCFLSSCQYCFTTTLPVVVGGGTLSLLVVWIGTLLLQLIHMSLEKHVPNVLGTLYSIVTYQPVLILIIVSFALHPPTQALVLEYLKFLISNPWWLAFLWLFWWKAVKIIVHTYSYVFLTEASLYRPVINPLFTPKDVTVICCTVSDFGKEFKQTILKILANSPGKIIVSTSGLLKLRKAQTVCKALEKEAGVKEGKIMVTAIEHPDKRAQFIHAAKKVDTPITCYADDHVFWPVTFLKHALAPFEDPLVGLVGTVKRVERIKKGTFKERLLNYIAVIYLERHNFECTASYNLDGGVFVISGRTALTRTEIIHSVEYRRGLLDEKWWWGKVGPMKVDDDNYTTRFMVNHGYKTVFHNEPAALIGTTLGIEGGYDKFAGQLIRWVRTTWRSNSMSLFAERKVWHAHPWTTYAMVISLFFNISLIYDSLLWFTLYKSGYLIQYWCALVVFLVVSKTIKQVPHLLRNPSDLFRYWICGMLFGYVHSVFKIWAFFTATNIEWTGRHGIEAVGHPDSERGLNGELVNDNGLLRIFKNSFPRFLLPRTWSGRVRTVPEVAAQEGVVAA